MDFDETMVENEFDEEAEVDSELPDGIIEEDEEEDLESVIADEEAPAEEPPEESPKETGPKEPGYVKQRIEKAVAKALAEQQGKFDRQMAPILERLMEMDARDLVASGKVKDLELAKELVRLRQGQPAPADADDGSEKGTVPQRNEKGQFVSQRDVEDTVRINMLKHQADRIKAGGGPDVIAEFQSNNEIKKKVIAGEMDFYDVADAMKSRKPGRKPPSPMRSPNGASGVNPNAIDSMSDEQFARLEKRIQEGARIRIR